MPSLHRIIGFLFVATLTVVVGNFIYGRFVVPALAMYRKAA